MELDNKRLSSAFRVGEKIRQLRIAEGLTQKQLAGDTISRNMLSMIESGTALPSLETLVHISDVLSVSPGFFFADENELMLYGKRKSIDTVYMLLENSEYENAAEICRQFAEHDTEMRSLLILCNLRIAERLLSKHMLLSASVFLNSAIELAENMPYSGDSITRACTFALSLSENVSKDIIPENLTDRERLSGTMIPISFLAYLSAYRSLKTGDLDAASAFARSGMLGEFHSLHIRGAVLMESGDYNGAARLLDLALTSSDGGFYSRYKLLCDLEVCRKNVGDFELAYSLSTSRMEMLGMFSK